MHFLSDNDVEDLRKRFEGLHHGGATPVDVTSDPKLGRPLYTTINPGAHIVVFEGGMGPKDLLHFPRYYGEKHGHHRTRRAYQAALVPRRAFGANEDYEHNEFVKQFSNQIQLINVAYDKEEHGRLRVVGRFGKLYFFDDPPQPKMTVEKLLTYDKKKKFEEGARIFRSTFIPKEMPHAVMESYLQEQGYKLISEEERIMIQLQPLKGKLQCTVLQDGDCEFLEFRYPDFKWIMFNVIRKDGQRRDVRLAVESIRDAYEEHDPAVLQYKGEKLVRRNEMGDLEITEKYRNQIHFVREKTTKRYKKTVLNAGEFPSEVLLVKSKEYSIMRTREGSNSSGEFDDVKDWREEVVIQPEVPDVDDAEAVKTFAKDFIRFCYNIESLC